MRMTLTLTLRLVKVRCNYANRKPIHDLLFDGDGNFLPTCHHFQDIYCRNVHELDLDLESAKVECKYDIKKSKHDFPFVVKW